MSGKSHHSNTVLIKLVISYLMFQVINEAYHRTPRQSCHRTRQLRYTSTARQCSVHSHNATGQVHSSSLQPTYHVPVKSVTCHTRVGSAITIIF